MCRATAHLRPSGLTWRWPRSYWKKASATWCFIGKVKLGTESASNPVYGVNEGVGMTSDPNGNDAVTINATKPGPPTSMDTMP